MATTNPPARAGTDHQGRFPLRPLRRSGRPFPWHILVFLGPAFLFYTIFMVYPLIDSMRLSAFNDIGQYVGLDNYRALFGNESLSHTFWNALWNNVTFFIIHIVLQNPIGLLLAALLTAQAIKGIPFYRTAIFVPATVSVVIVGFVWKLILSPLWGIVDKPFLGDASTSLPTLAVISVWQYVGIPMVLFFSVMVSIPKDFIEAARIDGATGWQVFWRVKFPLLLPMIGIVTILTYIANFVAFDIIYSVKGPAAGPDFASDVLGTFFYRMFLGHRIRVGSPTMGATVATVSFLIILAGVLIFSYVWQRRAETYEL